jgi:hypothetical protein
MARDERRLLLDRASSPGVPLAEVRAIAAVLGAGVNRARMLRAAHAAVWRLRQAGERVPFWLRVLESEYQSGRRKPTVRPAGLMAGILYDERRRRDAA